MTYPLLFEGFSKEIGAGTMHLGQTRISAQNFLAGSMCTYPGFTVPVKKPCDHVNDNAEPDQRHSNNRIEYSINFAQQANDADVFWPVPVSVTCQNICRRER